MATYNIGQNILLKQIIVCIAIAIWGLIQSADFTFIVLIAVWSSYMIYSLNKLYNRVILFAFGISFFVFLIGRELTEQFLGHTPDNIFIPSINHHAYIAMTISLLSIWIVFSIFANKINRYDLNFFNHKFQEKRVRRFSRLCFWFAYPFSIITSLALILFIIRHGYYSLYTDYSVILSHSPVLYLFSKIELILPASFGVFMATLPTKKEFKPLCIGYIVYIVLSLGSGQRSTFILGLLLLFIFFVYMQKNRPEERWFKKKYLLYAIIAMPLIATGATAYNSWRFNSNSDHSFTDGILEFVYQQGVTSYIVKRGYEFEERIPKGHIYSLEFLHSGLPARLFGNKVYQGNSVDHAINGGSFTHALSYVLMGSNYLSGAGAGSSYIAELYYDFGYCGIIIGSGLYGFFFTFFTKSRRTSLLFRSIAFIIIPQLLWAPRASFSGFLSFLLSPSILFMLIFIFWFSKSLKRQ